MKELLMEKGYEFSEDTMDLKTLAKEVARQVKSHG
jgi:hypothetical protein